MKRAVIVLAAGMGTRMRTSRPKVLHSLLGRPMIQHVLDAVRPLRPERTVVVLHPGQPAVREAVDRIPGTDTAYQVRMPGTAGAVLSGLDRLRTFSGTALVLNGDTPLVRPDTLKAFLSSHHRSRADLSVLSFLADDPFGYGRIIRDAKGAPERIVEEDSLSDGQKGVREVNSGIYALGDRARPLLRTIRMNARKREYYLTDILALASAAGLRCRMFEAGREEEFRGVNTLAELASAEAIMQRAIIDRHMRNGVRFLDPGSVIVHPGVRLAPDTIIYPLVILEGDVSVGTGTTILHGVRIADSAIGSGAVIRDHSVIESARIADGCVIGPFAHLRPGTKTGKEVRVGNFVEVKNASLGGGSKAMHLSYIGDASVGKNVNIGAGTITCNYDGVRKHRTVIGDDVFVGSDTQLVAPVTVGRGAFIGAGSTITNDVTPGALALSRTPQRELKGWGRMKKKRKGV